MSKTVNLTEDQIKSIGLSVNQFVAERMLCSLCGITMTATRNSDLGWFYYHVKSGFPYGQGFGCKNSGKTFKAKLTTMEVA